MGRDDKKNGAEIDFRYNYKNSDATARSASTFARNGVWSPPPPGNAQRGIRAKSESPTLFVRRPKSSVPRTAVDSLGIAKHKAAPPRNTWSATAAAEGFSSPSPSSSLASPLLTSSLKATPQTSSFDVYSGKQQSPVLSRRVYAKMNENGGDDQAADRVKVVVRVRPMPVSSPRSPGTAGGHAATTAGDAGRGHEHQESALEFEHEGTELNVFKREGPVYWHTFGFDKVLGPEADQEQTYATSASEVVNTVLEGYNGTVMAYGQTGAGKTYTIMNMEQDAVGIIPRAAAELFIKTRQHADEYKFRISMTCVQIYMEHMQDLLNPKNDNLVIREGAKEVYLAGATCVELGSLEQCLILLAETERNRKFAATKLNEASSRSHVVVMLKVERRRRKSKARQKATGATQGRRSRRGRDGGGQLTSSDADEGSRDSVIGKLFLVDLAGSERLKKSGSEGVRADEARSINSSLYFLGKCIKARAENSVVGGEHHHHHHVPFRESKLTRLLQESLSGNAKVSLIINVHPSSLHAEETISSLMFGSRAMEVDTKPVINESVPVISCSLDASGDGDGDGDDAMDFSGVTQHGEVVGPLLQFDIEHVEIGDEEASQARALSNERQHALQRDEWKKEKAALIAAAHRSEAEWRIRLEESKQQRRIKVKETQAALKDALKMVASLNRRVETMEKTIAAMTIQKWYRRQQQQRVSRRLGQDVQEQRKRCLAQAKEEGLLLMRASMSMLHDANVQLTNYFLLPQRVRTKNLHLEEAARF